jgi:hypothetical protein
MPIRRQESQVKYETMRIGAFSGGINTSVPSNKIANDEAVIIRNKEFDDGDNLVTRNGVESPIGGIVGVWDETLWDESLWDSLGDNYPGRITSILDFEGASAFVGIIYTTGVQLISRTLGGVATPITGALTLPDGVRWYWKIFNGVAVGVNGLTSGHNPVQVVSPAPGTASHLTTAPPGNFIEVWGNRLWIARSDQPNQLQASDIGSHSSWNTDAGANPAHGAQWDLDKDDGDRITGLYAEKERLFVFKKKKILVGEAKDPSRPITDLRNVQFRIYSSKVGCIAATTIQPILDDVLFLAQGGVALLSAAQIVADFESGLISLKVADIQNIRQDLSDEDICSGILPDKSQYWLCVSGNVSVTGQDTTYVFDYKQLKRNLPRWVTFDGLAFGTSFEVYDHDVQNLVYLLGCHDVATNTFSIGKYTPKALVKTFVDGALAINKFVLTKSYDFEKEDERKYLIEWYKRIFMLTNTLSLSISYFLDDSSSVEGSYPITLAAELGGTFFDDPLTFFDDDGLFDEGTAIVVKLIRRAFLFDKTRKARNVQFSFLNNQVNQGYGITGFGIKHQLLSEYRAQTD